MLDTCAPSHTWSETKHHYRVAYKGKLYPSLPKGGHGKRKGRADIETGHVKKMARFLGFLTCAKQQLGI